MDSKINGTVENIVYKNDEKGFAVIEMDVNGELVTVVGELFGVSVGEELTVYGEFVNHPTFGPQFKAGACEVVLPSDATAIYKYLSNGAISGIGPALARRMVDAFSDKTLDVIAKAPEQLTNIKGISKEKAKKISEEFKKIYGVREVFAEMSSLGLDMSDSLTLYRAYGDFTPELIKGNPYMICGFPVYKEFSTAEALAAKLGYSSDDVNRIRAGIIYILRHNLNNGHTCVPVETLITKASDFLEIERDTVEIALFDAAEEGKLSVIKFSGTEYAFLCDMAKAERYIAERLLFLKTISYKNALDAGKEIAEFEKFNKIEYEELQKRAISASLTSGAVVITGGPGTGKTTALNAIIALCEKNGDRVSLCAPTGRAAKRLFELTGREAKTVHRLLEMDYKDGNLSFVHNEENPLKSDVIVIDEMSMVDAALFEALLRGIQPHCRLVMVGDFNQLPSVGAGNVLRDIIESGVCETVELQKIFRQAAKSLIVVNAHSIVNGEMPDIETRNNDFFFLKTTKEDGAALICGLIAQRLPKSYKYDPYSDIQILSPSRIGELGTVALNEKIRARLNPKKENKGEIRIMGTLFREGDRVMQTRNNYDITWTKDGGEKGIGVFNGDIGIIENIDHKRRVIKCFFDDRTVEYTFEQAVQLEAAFAVTVHKSQGSEFPCVILSLCGFPRKLCYRNLLYTAVTRARERLIIVGDQETLEAMVQNDKKSLRYTGLAAFLRGEIE